MYPRRRVRPRGLRGGRGREGGHRRRPRRSPRATSCSASPPRARTPTASRSSAASSSHERRRSSLAVRRHHARRGAARADAHLREAGARAHARRAGEGHGAHHRRRPPRERAAHAAARACRRASRARRGSARRSSRGCSATATSPTTRCIASSIAASAWRSWSRRSTPSARSSCSTAAGERVDAHRRHRRAAGGRARRRRREPDVRATAIAPDGAHRASPCSISGRGSNLARDPGCDARRHARRRRSTRVDLQSRAMPAGLRIAAAHGVATRSSSTARSRSATRFDAALAAAIDADAPDLVVLAGFMRVLGAAFVRALRRTHDQHPSVAAAALSRACTRIAARWPTACASTAAPCTS